MSRKVIGLLMMVFGILFAGFLAAIGFGVMIMRWRAPEYSGYESSLMLALVAVAGVAVGIIIYKLGVKIADRLPSE